MAEIKQLEKAIHTAVSTWQFRRAMELCQELLTAVPLSHGKLKNVAC